MAEHDSIRKLVAVVTVAGVAGCGGSSPSDTTTDSVSVCADVEGNAATNPTNDQAIPTDHEAAPEAAEGTVGEDGKVLRVIDKCVRPVFQTKDGPIIERPIVRG